MGKPRVILRKCEDYRLDRLAGVIRESCADLDIRLQGKVFIKPNVVTANRKYIRHSYTHPAMAAAMIQVLQERDVEKITVGESGGFGIPSRLFLKESDYLDVCGMMGVAAVDLNEHAMAPVDLEKGRWHKSMLLSRFIREADTKIWMPKLKYHIFCSITCALKLNIGILAHSERMMFHDHRIHEKIVDVLEAGYPDLVVTDAVDITYGFESAPYPVRLGALILSDHPLANDVVAAHVMGYRPEDIKHLRIASERGYGSLSLDDLEIGGDVGIEELAARPKGNRTLFQNLSELPTPIEFFAGLAPGTDAVCDGGCEGAVKGCLGTIEKRRPGSLARARKGAIVTGIYHGDVIVPDGTALLIGDCTQVTGRLEAKKVRRIKGCPIGARDLLIHIPLLFGMPSPMLDARDASLFVTQSVAKGVNILTHRMLGR
ncbi:MAG: DUF362 domain-containing protein [Proteobacteria bacterium]|nr:DUF362 domain-containing protein [Pseudomonadota bacterium]